MNQHIGVTGTIERIIPGASYQGTTYDQTIEVSLPDGTDIEIFDKTVPITSEEIVGDSRELILLALTNSGVEKIEERHGIVADADTTNCTISGEVIDLSVDDRWHLENHCYQDLLLLDIGYGTLLVERNQELRGLIESGELEIGDYLQVAVIRFDLLEIPK